eukprot:GILK01002207.1.p1 GENE.GILK01002207.1~~GILK01002207.1.p1  ORF type:complete len:173 (+),score=28.21 GILK01002207.1:38-520(+)
MANMFPSYVSPALYNSLAATSQLPTTSASTTMSRTTQSILPARKSLVTRPPTRRKTVVKAADPPPDADDSDENFLDKVKKRKQYNREAAQLSRQRKKAYTNQLERQVDSLKGTLTCLRSKESMLGSENKVLRDQQRFFQQVVIAARLAESNETTQPKLEV